MEEQRYYQKEIETMPVEELKKLQSEKLVKQVKHVYENVPYYRALMDEKGVKPEDIHGIEDLHFLPFLTKSDLRDAYPYGLLAVPPEDYIFGVKLMHRAYKKIVLKIGLNRVGIKL